MGSFSAELQRVRKKYFPEAAKTAWQHWRLKGLQINYAYYMRLEQGKALPTPEIVSQIAGFVGQADGEFLIKSYCAQVFPNSAYLFGGVTQVAEDSKVDRQDSVKALTQHFLNLRQVAVLGSCSRNYHLFLLATLARRPLKSTELSRYFKKSELEAGLEELVRAQVLLKVEGGYEAGNPDVRFPPAESEKLKETYRRLDNWDLEFGQTVELEQVLQKMILRRISFRYYGLIKKQLDLIFDTIRSADELDTKYNENVIQLQVLLKKGRLPG